MSEFVVFTETGARLVTNKRLGVFRNRSLPVVKNPDLVHVRNVKEIFWELKDHHFIVEMAPDKKREVLAKLALPHKSLNQELYPLHAKIIPWLFITAIAIGLTYMAYLRHGGRL